MKRNNNIRIIAENRNGERGFNIYLDFSGKREYLMGHRHNGLLYDFLKDGLSVNEMKRWKPTGNVRMRNRSRGISSMRLQNMVEHLILVVDEYMLERSAV